MRTFPTSPLKCLFLSAGFGDAGGPGLVQMTSRVRGKPGDLFYFQRKMRFVNEPIEQPPGMIDLLPVSHQERRTRQQLVPLLTLWKHYRHPVPRKISHPTLPSVLRHHTDPDNGTAEVTQPAPSLLDWDPPPRWKHRGLEQNRCRLAAGGDRERGNSSCFSTRMLMLDMDQHHGAAQRFRYL